MLLALYRAAEKICARCAVFMNREKLLYSTRRFLCRLRTIARRRAVGEGPTQAEGPGRGTPLLGVGGGGPGTELHAGGSPEKSRPGFD